MNLQKTWKILRNNAKIYSRKWGSKKMLCYYKSKTRKLEADDKAKKKRKKEIEYEILHSY